MDSTQLGPEKLEFATLTRVNGKIEFNVFTPTQITDLIASLEPEKEKK